MGATYTVKKRKMLSNMICMTEGPDSIKKKLRR